MLRLPLLTACLLLLTACGDASDVSGSEASGRASTADTQVAPASSPPASDPSATSAAMSADSLVAARGRLEQALDRYRRIADGGGWPTIPEGDLVEPGDSASAQVEALRERLAAEDALGRAGERSAVLDGALAGALARFQSRHGLAVDSLIGGNTRSALNVSAAERVAQIETTLDRWDDLPDVPSGPDARYVMVNVPEYTVRAFEGGREALQMSVVVGANYDDRATPLFHDEIDHVIFRPYWNVPPSIATEELVPDGPAALEEKGFEIVSHYAVDATVYDMTAANLRRVADGSLRIRQGPGPDNALGLVKYMFPNDYAVYLHDTPADQLFEEAARAFSHGCIRLERPAEFGAWVLGQQGWDEARVRENMTAGERQRVELDETIPVYIVYLPVWADVDGEVHFSSDVYDLVG